MMFGESLDIKMSSKTKVETHKIGGLKRNFIADDYDDLTNDSLDIGIRKYAEKRNEDASSQNPPVHSRTF